MQSPSSLFLDVRADIPAIYQASTLVLGRRGLTFVVQAWPSHILVIEVLRRSLESTLHTAVAVTDKIRCFSDAPVAERLLERIQGDVGAE